MKAIIYLLLGFIVVGCQSNDYGTIASKVVLRLTQPQGVYCVGQTSIIDLSTQQQGVAGEYQFSAVVLSGSAKLSVDGVDYAGTGDWCKLPHPTVKVAITPQAVGTLLIAFQTQSPSGLLSNKEVLSVQVEEQQAITIAADYCAKIIDPTPMQQIPIVLSATKEGYAGAFSVTCKQTKGQGKMYFHNYLVNTTAIEFSATDTIYYIPSLLGEHLLSFTFAAEGATTTKEIYTDVVRTLRVVDNVGDTTQVKILGAGEHNIEGEQITLSHQNKAIGTHRYNFAVVEWRDHAGKLLSQDSTYTLTLGLDSAALYHVKLLQTTRLSARPLREQPVYIFLPGHYEPVVGMQYYAAYDTDYLVPDFLHFYYEQSYYPYPFNTTTPEIGYTTLTLMQGTCSTSELRTIYPPLAVFFRHKDNPSLRFNLVDKYVESATTRYYMDDSSITLQP